MAAHVARNISVDVITWLTCQNIDRAGYGITTIECALRAAQNFDPIDVVKTEKRGLVPTLIDAVGIDCNGPLAP